MKMTKVIGELLCQKELWVYKEIEDVKYNLLGAVKSKTSRKVFDEEGTLRMHEDVAKKNNLIPEGSYLKWTAELIIPPSMNPALGINVSYTAHNMFKVVKDFEVEL